MRMDATVALSMLAVMLFAGCQNTINTVENSEKQAYQNIIADKRFVTDGALNRRLALRSVNVYPGGEAGNFSVEITATNVRTGFWAQLWSGLTGDNPYKVDYKFTWKDDNAMTVETPLSIWRTMVIIPGETVYFKSVAPNERCKDFVLNVKESK